MGELMFAVVVVVIGCLAAWWGIHLAEEGKG